MCVNCQVEWIRYKRAASGSLPPSIDGEGFVAATKSHVEMEGHLNKQGVHYICYMVCTKKYWIEISV